MAWMPFKKSQCTLKSILNMTNQLTVIVRGEQFDTEQYIIQIKQRTKIGTMSNY